MTHLEAVKNALPEGSALLITSEINQRWISGFNYTDGYIFVTHGMSYLLTDFRYIEAAGQKADTGFEVVMPQGTMYDGLKQIFNRGGFGCIAVEDVTIPLSEYDRLSKTFGNLKFVTGGSALIDSLREYKDENEIGKITKAQAITDAAFAHILGYISPERTEADVALELEFFMRSHGAEGTAFETIAVSGTASSMPHGVPRQVKLEKGFLTMDFGAKYDGYCSDMTRTVVIGRADSDMKRLYATVLEAQTAALEAMYGGERGRKKLDRIARDIIDNAGYRGAFGHSLGHGVGMYIHEAPGLSQRAADNASLGEGHVVTCEPGIYISGKYGCRIEDMVYIGRDGVLNFTKSPKNLIEL